MPLLQDFEQELKYQVIHSLSLFTWCHYGSGGDEKIPSLEFVTNIGYSIMRSSGDAELNDSEKRWKLMLQDYNYQLTDELDLVLAESVQQGYFVEGKFIDEAQKKNDAIVASKSEGSFREAWELFHGSFDDNVDEVLDGLYDSFNKNIKYISLSSLNGVVSLFRKLDDNARATEMITTYIDEWKDKNDVFNLEKNNFFGDSIDPEITEKFDTLYKESITTEAAAQILDRIADKNSWNQSDEVVLANTTVDDYYALFKSQGVRDNSSYVRKCLGFGSYTNATEQQKEIADRATQALKNIASESELNRLRVRNSSFGVQIADFADAHSYSSSIVSASN